MCLGIPTGPSFSHLLLLLPLTGPGHLRASLDGGHGASRHRAPLDREFSASSPAATTLGGVAIVLWSTSQRARPGSHVLRRGFLLLESSRGGALLPAVRPCPCLCPCHLITEQFLSLPVSQITDSFQLPRTVVLQNVPNWLPPPD